MVIVILASQISRLPVHIPGRFREDESQLEWCSQSGYRSRWNNLVAQCFSRI